jgi:hypothetical protein
MKALALLAAASWALTGCAAAPPKAAPEPQPQPAPLDPSYDWHVLLAAPLGSLLKDMPLSLHEVLLFREEAKPGETDDGDCHAIDGTAPSFISRVPEEYLLCFKHDRLAHIEATVRVPQAQAAQVFADACALWFKSAGLPAPLLAAATESAPAVCAGRDASTEFSGRLEVEADQAEAPLSIKIDAVEQR